MTYLIIPLLCFVLLAGIWWIFALYVAGEFWDGSVDELDRLLSDLMVAEPGKARRCLVMNSPGVDRLVKVTFHSSVFQLEVPLITTLQQRRRARYLDGLRELQLDPRNCNNPDGYDTLEWQVDGPAAQAAITIKNALVRVFEEENITLLTYQITDDISDQGAAAVERQAEIVRGERAGCISPLAGILLLPIPFMIAYLEYGYIAASAVLIAIFILREIYGRWKKRRTSIRFFDTVRWAILLLAGATIYYDDPLYLQLIPTIGFTAVGVAQVLSSVFKLPWLSLIDPAKSSGPVDAQLLPTLIPALMVTCFVGAVLNEYLRTVLSLDSWVWYFAFVRIELVLSFLMTALPIIIYREHKYPEEDSDPG